jgi:hypothetical protein
MMEEIEKELAECKQAGGQVRHDADVEPVVTFSAGGVIGVLMEPV